MEPESHPFLRARQRVGSLAAGMHFASAERAFHRSDVPARALAAKLDVQLALPERDKARWRADTMIGTLRHLGLERCTHQIATHDPTEYKYNFRAEVLPRARPAEVNVFGHTTRLLLGREHFHRTQEQPVHPALEDGRPRWDHDQQTFFSHDARRKQLAEQTVRWNAKAREAAARLLDAREADGRGARPTLVEREDARMEALRLERTGAYEAMSDSALRSVRERQLGWHANIRNEARLHESIVPATAPLRPAPANSQEAEYERLMAEAGAARTSSMAATRRDATTLTFAHEGVFEEARDPDGEVRLQWSCCAAGSASARGCRPARRDRLRWQYGA